jgi:glutamine cyclotransferase
VRLETGEIVKRVDLAPEYFGEGITFYKNEIIQLTWLSQTGFVYERRRLPPAAAVLIPREGWGLTTKGDEIFMSDGTPDIPRSRRGHACRKAPLHTYATATKPIDQLNELEYDRRRNLRQRLAD